MQLVSPAPPGPGGAAANAAASIPRIGANAVADDVISHNHQGIGFRRVTEKNLNLKIFLGEQDPRNKISYIKWPRLMKEHAETKGVDGSNLVSATN